MSHQTVKNQTLPQRLAHVVLRPFKPVLPVWLFLILVVVISFIPFAWREAWPVYVERVIFRDVPRDDYLVSLQNNRTLGCITAPRIKPEILVYGDSHVYANIDYQRLGQAWGNERIGSCPLPGGYIWSMQSLFRFFDEKGWQPETLIYVANYRQFRRTTGRQAFLESHAEILFNPALVKSTRREWAENYSEGKPPFGRSVESYNAEKNRHHDKVMSLSPEMIKKTLAVNNDRYLSTWRSNIELFALDGDIEANIQAVCRQIRKRGINLYVVHVPESAFLEDQYRPEEFKTYLDHVRSIDCARKILVGSLEDWKIDLRHYVNRRLYSRLDYSKFDGKEHPEIKKWNIYFDADHMNPFGAEIVTGKIIQAFPELKPENTEY